jgi:glycosyltransferase involved in cell wall biosynthesis
MDISVVIASYNEEESLPELFAWIDKVLTTNNFSYEIVIIDDGSSDNSWQIIEEHAAKNSNIKGIKLRRNYGKSAALHCGFQATKGDVVITMDADLQDNPEELPELYRMIKEEKFDLVSGWKKKRHDPLSKRLPSKFYNATVRMASGIKLHDFNCGLKAYRKQVVKSIELYGEMHRYIPVLAKKAGFKKIGEKVVQHQARKYGYSKFGIERYVKGYLDLMTVMFISKFGKSPMHLFGFLGTLMFFIGFVIAGYLGGVKLYHVFNNVQAKLVTENPYFYLALTTMIIGSQLFVAGFIGELISRSAADRNKYLVEKEINVDLKL